jgi:hypothetical protein
LAAKLPLRNLKDVLSLQPVSGQKRPIQADDAPSEHLCRVCMYVCMYGYGVYIFMCDICMYVDRSMRSMRSMYVGMHVCMYVGSFEQFTRLRSICGLYVCMYACIYMMYVHMHVYVCIDV